MALPARRPISGLRSAKLALTATAIAVVAAFGARLLPMPDASAMEVKAETETVGNIVFERSSDNMLGITNTVTGIRLEDNLDAAPTNATQDQLYALANETAVLVKDELGWDLNLPADGTRVMEEVQSLAQALGTIPDEELQLEENAPLLALRDLADQLEGTAECRGRCLPEGELVKNRVVAVMAGATVNKVLGLVTTDSAGAHLAIYAMSLYFGVMVDLVLKRVAEVSRIQSSDLRLAVIGGLVGVLGIAKGFAKDAQSMAAKNGDKVRDEAKKAAQDVADATPADPAVEDPRDYDMIKDEL